MKPISEMTDKEFDKYLKTIKPTLPPWCKDGAKCSHYSSEGFVDRKWKSSCCDNYPLCG